MEETKTKKLIEIEEFPNQREYVRVKGIRLDRGLTQQDLADAIGFSRAGIANNEESDRINLDTLRKYSLVLDVDFNTLLGYDAEEAG